MTLRWRVHPFFLLCFLHGGGYPANVNRLTRITQFEWCGTFLPRTRAYTGPSRRCVKNGVTFWPTLTALSPWLTSYFRSCRTTTESDLLSEMEGLNRANESEFRGLRWRKRILHLHARRTTIRVHIRFCTSNVILRKDLYSNDYSFLLTGKITFLTDRFADE